MSNDYEEGGASDAEPEASAEGEHAEQVISRRELAEREAGLHAEIKELRARIHEQGLVIHALSSALDLLAQERL